MEIILKVNNIFDKLFDLSLKDSRKIILLVEKCIEITTVEATTLDLSIEYSGDKKIDSEEKVLFDLFLEEIPDASKKMKTVVLIREITKSELKIAKTVVEKAPTLIKSGLNKQEAEDFKKRFDVIGVKVEIK